MTTLKAKATPKNLLYSLLIFFCIVCGGLAISLTAPTPALASSPSLATAAPTITTFSSSLLDVATATPSMNVQSTKYYAGKSYTFHFEGDYC